MRIQSLCLLILALLAVSFISTNAQKKKKNYYEILEVEKDATAKEIKRSYFKLAMKYHPDKNPDAPDKSALDLHFSAISHAYQVLSEPAVREKYDLRLKQGEKEYTSEDMKREEERAEYEQKWRDSFEMFAEEERLSEEEEKQQRREKALLLAMGIGLIGIAGWYINKSKKMKKALGVSGESSTNANTSKTLQNAIRQDHERLQSELDKQREKEEKEKAHAEKIFENVQKRRAALAAEEEERLAAEQEERENQRAHELARRRAMEEGNDETNFDENLEGEPTSSYRTDRDIAIATESMLDDEQRVKDKGPKNAAFYCKPCKKAFKSEGQLENHYSSKQHKQILKDAEKAARKKGATSPEPVEVNEPAE